MAEKEVKQADLHPLEQQEQKLDIRNLAAGASAGILAEGQEKVTYSGRMYEPGTQWQPNLFPATDFLSPFTTADMQQRLLGWYTVGWPGFLEKWNVFDKWQEAIDSIFPMPDWVTKQTDSLKSLSEMWASRTTLKGHVGVAQITDNWSVSEDVSRPMNTFTTTDGDTIYFQHGWLVPFRVKAGQDVFVRENRQQVPGDMFLVENRLPQKEQAADVPMARLHILSRPQPKIASVAALTK